MVPWIDPVYHGVQCFVLLPIVSHGQLRNLPLDVPGALRDSLRRRAFPQELLQREDVRSTSGEHLGILGGFISRLHNTVISSMEVSLLLIYLIYPTNN